MPKIRVKITNSDCTYFNGMVGVIIAKAITKPEKYDYIVQFKSEWSYFKRKEFVYEKD